MAGTDTVRGIGYQQAQAVLIALDLLSDEKAALLRVEGVADIIDVELLTEAGEVVHGKQIKTRLEEYTWGKAELVGILRRWAALKPRVDATFEFLTDGRLGSTGEEVRSALWNAAHGDRGDLATLLGVGRDSVVCVAASRASIRTDPAKVSALLSRADRQLASMLPPARTRSDKLEQARSGVDSLFRLLLDRAGQNDKDDRLLSRQELAEAAGVVLELATRHWEVDYVERYCTTIEGAPLGEVIPVAVRRMDLWPAGPPSDDAEAIDRQLEEVLEHRVALITGRTGAGKSTAASLMSRLGAQARSPVVLAHAESYIAGHLSALVADAIGSALEEDVTSSVGHEALSDDSTTLVIDGVSEVPHSVRQSLANDLAPLTSSGRGCRLVLIGRDVAALRAALPTSSAPAVYVVAPLTEQGQLDLARRLASEREAENVLDAIHSAIGEGVENPLLLTMALSVSAGDGEFNTRASLYDAFLGMMAARSGTPAIEFVAAVLGVVFAGLLDDERRYADAFEWRTRLSDAIGVVGDSVGPQFLEGVEEGCARAGLAVPIDFTGTMVPLHDSFADYLAGKAHARGLVDLPVHLTPTDEQRVLFAAECGGVTPALARHAIRELPFLTPRLASHDRRQLTASNLDHAAELLAVLLPPAAASGIAACDVGDGRVVVMLDDHTRWLASGDAKALMARSTGVVLRHASPLRVVAELWRNWIDSSLVARRGIGSPRPDSQESAESILRTHAEETARLMPDFIRAVSPAGAEASLMDAIGPTGILAVVFPIDTGPRGESWPVTFAHADAVDVRRAKSGESPEDEWTQLGARSSVEYLTRDSFEWAAIRRVRAAINALTAPRWLDEPS